MSNQERQSKSPKLPLVSVLMPAYNAEKYVVQSLMSQIAQTYNNWELLVADDGSTDKTRSLIDTFEESRIRWFHRETNQGYLKTWNDLLIEAKGQYITFLDADDYIRKDRIELLVTYLEENNQIAICGTGMGLVNEQQQLQSERLYPERWLEIKEALYEPRDFPFCGSAVMVRRSVMEAIGGYRPFFDRLGWEDHDWLIRCCEHFKAANLPEVAYYYRQNPDSVSRHVNITPLSVRRMVIKEIGLILAQQRRERGSDLLMEEDSTGLASLIEKYESPYRQDPSKIYRAMSSRAINNKNGRAAIVLAWQAVRRDAFRFSNYLSLLRAFLTFLYP